MEGKVSNIENEAKIPPKRVLGGSSRAVVVEEFPA
jgi:hypothetical protein